MIKLITCDLDGTVLDDEKNIDSELKEVVTKLKEKGILFTVASGRSRELLLHILDYFNLVDNAGISFCSCSITLFNAFLYPSNTAAVYVFLYPQ